MRAAMGAGKITSHKGQQVTDLAGTEVIFDVADAAQIGLGIRAGAAPSILRAVGGAATPVLPSARDVKGDALYNRGFDVPASVGGVWHQFQFTSRGMGEALDKAQEVAGVKEGQLLAATIPPANQWAVVSGAGAYGAYSYKVPTLLNPRAVDPASVPGLDKERAERAARRQQETANQDVTSAAFISRFSAGQPAAAPGYAAAPAYAAAPGYPPPGYAAAPGYPPQGYAAQPPFAPPYAPPPQGYAPPPQQAYAPQPAPAPQAPVGGFSGALPRPGEG